jgi:hypothetical protein
VLNIRNIPKRKRLKKQARLNLAMSWIEKYDGNNIIAGYAKWFGVDKICAINELKAIGVVIPDSLENQIIASLKDRLEKKRIIQEKKENAETTFIESDDNFGFIAGYISGGFPYGLTHEEFDRIKLENLD